MSAAKYFVWGEGVWRELDVSAGCVAGWRRRARFVFVRRGRLLVARRRAVLRALQALTAGRPGAAADGPRLSHRSKSAAGRAKQRRELPAPSACDHHHCCAHYNGYNHNNNKVAVQPAAPPATAVPPAPPAPPPETPSAALRRREAATQCGGTDAATSTAHAITISVNHKLPPATRDSSSGDDFVIKPARRPPPKAHSSASAVNALLGKQVPAPATKLPAAVSSDSASADTDADESSHERRERARTRKRPRTVVSESTSADERPLRSATKPAQEVTVRGGVCKELVISEGDVAALRGFVARTRATALQRFDADDDYKRALFYAINPLVELQRCARLERLLAERRAAALPHFAARLGLAPRPAAPAPPRRRPAPRRHRQPSSTDTDKVTAQCFTRFDTLPVAELCETVSM